MACSTCASLKCFESCYSQFNIMKQSNQILQEADFILSKINDQEFTDSSLLRYIISKQSEDSFGFKSGVNNFCQMVIDYVLMSSCDGMNNEEKREKISVNKERITEILSILRFESIDINFFYHYMFKKESQNNLIREDKIIHLLKLFNLNAIENILSIPSFSFIHSNYLSNCEFANFFKAILSSSVTNDFSSLYQSIFQYLQEQNEQGQLTQGQLIEFMKRSNIDHFDDIIRRVVNFITLPSSQHQNNDADEINLNDFNEIFRILCKIINLSLKNEIFDIAYKRKDLCFSGKVNNNDALCILDELAIVYTNLNKEKVMNFFNEIEISYFKLLSSVSSEIDLSNLF